MKYILLVSLLIALSCNQSKNEKKETKTTQIEKTVKKEKVVIEEVKEQPILKTQEELIIVLKNPKSVLDAKELIENSSLVWKELVIDNVTLKAALIKVPVDKKDFWIDQLQKSNIFSSVEIKTKETINSIKLIAENTFVKIRKTHCSGDCAVYDVLLFNDGKVIFNGIENVLIKGKKEFTISETSMKKIQRMFAKTSFGKYFDSYVDTSLMDYQSTFITHKNKQIEIKLWKNVPLELALAYESLEDILFEKKCLNKEMNKIAIYLVPGLAAGPEIFENLNLSEDKYELHYLEWKRPLALEESISNYAMRMCEDVKEKNPVLVGVSFGGIMVQEMSKYLDTKKVILISSVKTNHELPKRFKLAKFTKAYKLFPTKIVSNFEDYAKYFLGKSLKKRAKIYNKYLSVRSKTYLNWSISAVLNWQQDEPLENVIHIHGTDDHVFPIKNIDNCIKIKNEGHVMIITKAKKISKIIDEILIC